MQRDVRNVRSMASPSGASELVTVRVLACGNVGAGTSTLIDRLLRDARMAPEEERAGLARESRKAGGTSDNAEISLLLDALSAEAEQGSVADVVHRYFSTQTRNVIVADTPGQDRDTRSLVAGASASDAAVIVVDAREEIVAQTHRQAVICHMLGIRRFLLAVNKMDLVGYDPRRFETLASDFRAFAALLGGSDVTCIPVAATDGRNVVERCRDMGWHAGHTLLSWLETVETGAASGGGFRLPVQRASRSPDDGFRGYAGTLARGPVHVGDEIVVLPSHRQSRISRIITRTGEAREATPGESVVLGLVDDMDLAQGDVIAAAGDVPTVADEIAADLVSLSSEDLLPGRQYVLRCGPQTIGASITRLKHTLNVDNLDHLSGRSMHPQDVGACNLALARPLVFDPYDVCREMGRFILTDKASGETVAAGVVRFALRRALNVRWQDFDVDRTVRAGLKHQTPFCLWFTGLSGAGKSTLANLLDKRLVSLGRHTFVLDGDNVRHGLNKDLGFTEADRVENIRRVAEVARLMVDAGLIVLVSFISPFRAERQMARELFARGEFLELFVDTPLEVCEARDPKGLYRKARAGLLANFTGIDSDYEAPAEPELRVSGAGNGPDACVEFIFEELKRRGLI